jgi:hypothetical protein
MKYCYNFISMIRSEPAPAGNELVFIFEEEGIARRARSVLARLPPLTGEPIRIQNCKDLRDRHGPIHAGAFLRERRIAFDCRSAEFARIFAHEVFHFVWLRLGNPRRRSYEEMLGGELTAHARGELGWSAEWHKRDLGKPDVIRRTRFWREYCCESFCDSAAWVYSGVRRHEEFTLAGRFRDARRRWFSDLTAARQLSI